MLVRNIISFQWSNLFISSPAGMSDRCNFTTHLSTLPIEQDLYKTTRKKFTRKINRIKRSIWKVSFNYWSCLSLSYFVVTSNPRETFSRQLCTMDRCRWIIPSMRVPTIDQRCFFFLETTSPSFCNRESFQRPIKNKSVGIARP